jgi:hypothetical protein
MLRIVPHTVPRVGRSYEHFPDGFELHLLPFPRFFFLSYRPTTPAGPAPSCHTHRVRFSYPSAPSSRGGMTDRTRSAAHPTFFPASPSTPTAATTPATTPTAPAAHNTLPSLSRPALEQSGAHPLVRRAHSGRSPPIRSAGASRRPMHHLPRLAPSSAAPPHHFPALHCSPAPALAAGHPAVCAELRRLLRAAFLLSSPFPPSHSTAPHWHAHPASCSASPYAPLSSSPPPTTRSPTTGGQVKSGFWTRFCLSSKNRFEKNRRCPPDN